MTLWDAAYGVSHIYDPIAWAHPAIPLEETSWSIQHGVGILDIYKLIPDSHEIDLSLLQDVPALFRTRIILFPASTTSFGLINTFSTVAPSTAGSARTVISSFMASRTVSVCSVLITSPGLTWTFQTLALRGDSTLWICGSTRGF